VKGSFTGAVKDQAGQLIQCNHGTAFFDELGELPAMLQAKLLRVVQEQTFTPVGKVGVQSMAARNLAF
jgi:transcriptional regulator with PAS, ATPase and Fis domain